ncbi:MAG: patatin-like phospholipase family protein [Opitutaceae bacterium]
MNPASAQNALLLVGGGARAAYQAGVLRSLARAFPKVRFPILNGISAGAINAALLANTSDEFLRTTERLVALWENLTLDQVFRTQFRTLGATVLKWAVRMAAGGGSSLPAVREMVDTSPLRDFLLRALDTKDGVLRGIEANLASGRLSAVGFTTSKYPSGQSTTWVQGRDVVPWQHHGRCGVSTALTVEHIMASSALPLVFPAVRLADGWHGDGGVRLTAPLSSSVYLGADRIVAISTLRSPTPADTAAPFPDYPPTSTVLGMLIDSVFVDMLDTEAMAMRQLNQLGAGNPRGNENHRPVDVIVIRPSEDLGTLAREFESDLPRALRQVFQALGSHRSDRSNIIATLLFQPRYLRRVLEIGERDGMRRRDELAAFLGFDGAPSSEVPPPIVQLNGTNRHRAEGTLTRDSLFPQRSTGTEG